MFVCKQSQLQKPKQVLCSKENHKVTKMPVRQLDGKLMWEVGIMSPLPCHSTIPWTDKHGCNICAVACINRPLLGTDTVLTAEPHPWCTVTGRRTEEGYSYTDLSKKIGTLKRSLCSYADRCYLAWVLWGILIPFQLFKWPVTAQTQEQVMCHSLYTHIWPTGSEEADVFQQNALENTTDKLSKEDSGDRICLS